MTVATTASSGATQSALSRVVGIEATDALVALQSQLQGLSATEASRRLTQYGLNEVRPEQRSLWRIVREQLQSGINILLVVAGVLTFATGDSTDGAIIVVLVALNIGLSIFQEYRAERALAALRALLPPQVRVWRDGALVVRPSSELVPGDVVIVRMGDVIPADLRVLDTNGLEVDQATLTGESVPQAKSVAPVMDSKVTAWTDALFAGTTVISGQGTGVVAATGAQTQFGETAALLRGERAPSDFQANLTHFGTFLLRFGVLLALIVFFANFLLGRGLVPSFALAVAIALGVVPEALPAVTATTLALGAAQLARQKVLVRRLAAIEDLSVVNVLCTDKTGTLTENRTELTEIWTRLDESSVMESAVLCSTFPEPDNVVDQALVDAARTRGIALEALPTEQRVILAPFSAETKSMVVSVGSRLLSKGAANAILKRCGWLRTNQGDVDLSEQQPVVDAALGAQQNGGYRVLAVGEHDFLPSEPVDPQARLSILALLGFTDPPRPDAASAVAAASALGVEVKIVTGDALGRASALVRQIGLDLPPDGIVSADELRGPGAVNAAQRGRIFAGVIPADKFRLVRLLQSVHSHVAMTGDGVNDAPALRGADVGIAVASGSEAAKGAADIVLLQDHLQVIVDAIAQGRRIFTNINRYLLYTMVSNFANVLIVAIASLFVDYLPLLPGQVLLLNLVADLPMLAVATDRVPDEDIAVPRRWDVRRIMDMALYLGVINAIGAFGLLRLVGGGSPEQIHTAWFLYLGITSLLILFSVRTPRPVVQSVPPSSELLIALGAALIIVLGLALLQPTQTVLGLVPLSPLRWLEILAFAAGYLIIAEVAKLTLVRPHAQRV